VLWRALVMGLILSAFCSWAPPIKLATLKVGSRLYKNVTVLGANSLDVYFTHSEGITSVHLKYLDPELQKRFNYDPKAAAEAERRLSEDNSQYLASVASNIAAQAEMRIKISKAAAAHPEQNLADPVADGCLIGKAAPGLKGVKWFGDKPALEGKYVLVSFWAPWSMPCRKTIPQLNALQKAFTDRLVVIGVTADSESAVEQMTEPQIEFASALDPGGIYSRTVGVTSVPYVLLVDPGNTVRYQGHPAAITEKILQAALAVQAESR
jgi:thiol-disulfide isomerase/thioredoxin